MEDADANVSYTHTHRFILRAGTKLQSHKSPGHFGFWAVDMVIDDTLQPWLLKLVDMPGAGPSSKEDNAKLREVMRTVVREVVEMQHEVVRLSVSRPDRRLSPEDFSMARGFFLVGFQDVVGGEEHYYPF